MPLHLEQLKLLVKEQQKTNELLVQLIEQTQQKPKESVTDTVKEFDSNRNDTRHSKGRNNKQIVKTV